MQYILIAYMVLFGGMGLLMTIAELLSEPQDRDPIWETAVDAMGVAILFAGMLFLSLGVSDPSLKAIWLFAAPAVVVAQLVISWRARKNAPRQEAKKSAVFADLGTLALMLPALAFNLMFALSES